VATKASCMTGFKTLCSAIYKSHRRINKPYVALYSKLNFIAWRLTCQERERGLCKEKNKIKTTIVKKTQVI